MLLLVFIYCVYVCELEFVGMLPIYSFKSDGSVPPPDVRKDDASGVPIAAGERPTGTYANAFAKVGPAVVHICVPNKGQFSGTIIDKYGTILTCAHGLVDLQIFGDSYKGKVGIYINFCLI